MDNKLEQRILRAALVILLLLTLIRIIWSDVTEIKKQFFNNSKVEEQIPHRSK